ncbi:MAG: PhnD/SsuA/transferrin family substrate-binding protein [Pseudomonadota bacterium]
MRRFAALIAVILALAFAAAPAGAGCFLRLAVTDLEGYEQVQREFGPFVKVLAAHTGCSFDFLAVRSRTEAVGELNRRQVDLVLTGPAEYVVFHQLTKARPLVGFSRPDYFAGIMVMAESGLTDARSLKGKKVAFGDVGSTSTHLAPMQILADNGLDPLQDIQSVHFSRHHDQQMLEALIKGEVAAIGFGYSKLLKLRDRAPGIPHGAFRFLARGPDLPHDILLVGAHVPPATVALVRQTLIDHEPELVKAILQGRDNQKYRGMKFITSVQDADYNYIRQMYATIGFPSFSRFFD